MKTSSTIRVFLSSYFLILFSTAVALHAQQHQPDLQWLTLETQNFSVHYPAGFEKLAQRVADLCEQVYEPVSASLHYRPRHTPVVIHTRADFANGFVAPLPWRMELFLTEPQDDWLGSRDTWLRVLITHELTHVVQLRKTRGLSALTYPFLGELNSFWQFLPPSWFIEGFATHNETRFTSGGRGRNPYHWMQMQAPLSANKPWRLENTNHFSRKYLPPGMNYVTGYYLTAYITEHYGPDAWAKILDRYTSLPLLGFDRAVKKVTGNNSKRLYKDMLREFSTPKRSTAPAPRRSGQVWLPAQHPENQLSVRWRDAEHLLVYRTSYDALPELAMLARDGKKSTIRQRHLTTDDNALTVGKQVIVWSSLSQHPRFSATEYADLEVLNLSTGKLRRLTHNARVYCPDLAPDGKRLVAVQTALPTTRLVIIDTETGAIKPFLEIARTTLLNPRWSHDGNRLAVACKDSTGKQDIVIADATTGAWAYVFTPDPAHDNSPCWTPDDRFLLYSSDRSGIFNIWAVEVATGKRWQVTDEPLGAFSPDVSPTGGELAYSGYSFNGFLAKTCALDSSQWLPEIAVAVNPDQTFHRDSAAVTTPTRHASVAGSHGYQPWGQILRPQGWLPFALADEKGTALGAFAMSNEVLHRHAWQGVVTASTKNLRPSWDVRYTYSRWWPELTVRSYNLPDRVSAQLRGEVIEGWWRKRGYALAISVPLTLASNVYTTQVRSSLGFIAENRSRSTGIIYPRLQNYRGVQMGTQFFRGAQTVRDVVPHRAIALGAFADWSLAEVGSDFSAHQFAAYANFFVPTMLRHQQLQILGIYQGKYGDYGYDNFGTTPIGYDDLALHQQLRVKIAYHAPLAYIEWPVPVLPLYLDYLSGTLFYDWGTGWDKGTLATKNRRAAAGVSLTIATAILRVLSTNIGVAYFYRTATRDWRLEPMLGVGF